MGFAIWALALVAVVSSAWLLAVRLGRGRGLFERMLITTVGVNLALVAVVRGLGFFDVFTFGPTLVVTFGFSGAAGLWAWRGAGVTEQLRSDLGAFKKLWHCIHEERALPVYWLMGLGAVAFGVSAWHAAWFPNWSWDVSWYHEPMATFAAQLGSTKMVDTANVYINVYPKNVELISAWTIVLTQSTRLDDWTQLGFGVMGCCAVAAFCRRFQLGRAMSCGLGASWLLLPAVALQLHTTHADVAAGSLFLASMYFLTTRPLDSLALALTVLAFGLYVGSKVTGVFHLLLVSPLVLLRVAIALWRQNSRRSVLLALSACVPIAIALGGHSHIRNAFLYKNPMYPASIRLPLFGVLPGVQEPEAISGGSMFLQGDGVARLTQSWLGYLKTKEFHPHLWPDIRGGGFGAQYPYILGPSVILVSVLALFARRLELLTPLLVTVLALMVPAAWWPRLTLGAAGAGLAAFGAVLAWVRFKWLQVLLLNGLTLAAVFSYVHSAVGYKTVPALWGDEAARRAEQVVLRGQVTWLWPIDWAIARDELPEGSIIADDNSGMFLGEYWGIDFHNQVVIIPWTGDRASFVAKVQQVHPTWMAVGINTPAEAAIRDGLGGTFLFAPGVSNTRMYRLNW